MSDRRDMVVSWLRAKPWPRRRGWRYRLIYRAHREPVTWPDKSRREGYGRLRAAWYALTFPHVHDEDDGS